MASDSKTLEVKILDNFSVHSEITNTFRELCCESLSKTIRFFQRHSTLPKKDQKTEKFEALAMVMMALLMPKIHSFSTDEATKSHGTEHNWGIILGQITEKTNQMGTVHTSHPIVKNSTKVDVLFYQRMEITFLTDKSKVKKCEAVVYC